MEPLAKYSFLFFFFFSLQFSAQEELDSQLWSEDNALEWSDFKAVPQNNTDAVAITASGITFGYSVTRSQSEIVDATFTVESHFYPDHSWFKKGKVNAVVLDHERFHFNITELFARKFRKQIAETRFTTDIQNEADAIYKRINEALKAMQNKYDAETNYSMNIENQKAWQLKIESELQKFSKYKLH